MLPENLEWFFPGSVEEALELIKKPGAQLHSGGTRILKTRPDNIKTLVDVGKLKLDYISYSDNAFYIGAASSFSQVIGFLKERQKLPMLTSSLLNAASTPLRNRITIGGSIKDFPIWSSLYAPLIALDARVEIAGELTGIFPVEEYVEKKIINGKHIIKQVIIDDVEGLSGGIKKFSVVKFEYPVFNIAAALKFDDQLITRVSLVITGVRNRYQRFQKAENFLTGKNLTDQIIEETSEMITPDFCSDYRYTSEYKKLVARVFFRDLLTEIREECK